VPLVEPQAGLTGGTIFPGSFTGVQVDCRPGYAAVNGAITAALQNDLMVIKDSYPAMEGGAGGQQWPQGWNFTVANTGSTPITFTAYPICVQMPTAP
jgi:hypothetical protein